MKRGTISQNVLAHLQKLEKEKEIIDIWCELKLLSTIYCTKPQLLPAAHPNLDDFGDFFDRVDTKFNMVGGVHQDLDEDSDFDLADKVYVASAKLFAFY